MKNLILLFAIVMLALGSCEEIIFEKIYIKGDSIPGPVQFITTSTERECETTDSTVDIVIQPILKNGEFSFDTLLNVTTVCNLLIKVSGYTLIPRETVVHDSIVYKNGPTVYVDRPVIVYDTIRETYYDRTVVHKDTLYYPSVIRQVTSIPVEIQPHVIEFFTSTREYGISVPGGNLIVSYVHPEDLPGEDWVSESFWIGGDIGQMYIGVSESLPPEQHRASILRELARLQMKKKYVTDPAKLMCPLFPPSQQITQTNLNDLFSLPI